MPPLARVLFLLGLAGLVAFALGACSKSPTEPAPKPSAHRTVTAVVTDSLGAPIDGASLTWVSLTDSAGLLELRTASTDADGENLQVLREGGWIVGATTSGSGPRLRAAGASFVVAGDWRAAADTQVVRLVVHTSAIASGTCTLAGRVDHSGTLVSGWLPLVAATDADGHWALEGLPLGRWELTFEHFGFKLGIATVTVTTPGQNVAAPALQLLSDPLP